MVNMVENPPSESSVNPVGLQIAQAFGVENAYLLRYVTDEEFAEKCEEMLTDKKMTGADILAWCDYMESIEDNRPQLYRSTHVSIKDVRDKMGSQERPAGDAATNTPTVAAASTILGPTPLTATANGKIDSNQATSTARYCSDDVSEDSTLRVPQLSDFVVEVDTGCSSSIITSNVETALIAADISLKLYQWMDELPFASVSRIYCLRFDSTAKLKYVKQSDYLSMSFLKPVILGGAAICYVEGLQGVEWLFGKSREGIEYYVSPTARDRGQSIQKEAFGPKVGPFKAWARTFIGYEKKPKDTVDLATVYVVAKDGKQKNYAVTVNSGAKNLTCFSEIVAPSEASD
ncbi:hypothetical protein FOZ62_028572, partial [Perkinsus olseni]